MNYYRLLLIITSLLSCTLTRAQSPYWQQSVDYTIDVTLNDQDHTLDAFERIRYTNNSPDTLAFIWIHCWPNAYKTDRTAFSDQLLDNGRTDFYFSSKDQRGYINHLDFRVDGQPARMEDHPQFIDIVRIWLPQPLPPGHQIEISTPFHEQLPWNFSRGGHTGHSYQITQWYPKPAVYDRNGWHEMPYLDQGEFYSEFGNFDVRITLPETYTVAAPGNLQPGSASNIGSIPPPVSLRKMAPKPPPKKTAPKKPTQKTTTQKTATQKTATQKTTTQKNPAPQKIILPPMAAAASKTLRYRLENAHDFAWFADTRLKADQDTLALPSGKTIDVYAYYSPSDAPLWKNTISYIKSAIRFRSTLIGDYPYNTCSIVEARTGTPGGMEYPAIASISPDQTNASLELLVEHEVGHNWFYAALGSNERRYPWMDEGLNTFYDNRYSNLKARKIRTASGWLQHKLPEDQSLVYINSLARTKKDQPISTPSENFTTANYDLIPYDKTAAWLKSLQDSLGADHFDSAMRKYYRDWKFRHPQPQDFQNAMAIPSLAALDKKGPATPEPPHIKWKPTFLFNFRNTDSIRYIGIGPAIGYNKYDGGMIGILLHNYNLPPSALQFIIAPLYGISSHELGGAGRVSWSAYPDKHFSRITAGIATQKFSSSSALDSNGKKLYGSYYTLEPSLRFEFPNANPRSTLERSIAWKTWLIGERKPGDYTLKSADSLYYPSKVGKYEFRYLNQLSFQIADKRVLYPYSAVLQLQQSDRFYRFNFTGSYFFNYSTGGPNEGMKIRLFAAKFGYLGGNSSNLDLSRFMPKLTGIGGAEDYTYSAWFTGRNEYTGFFSQQIMDRDGGLKIRTPSFPWLEGRSDDWVAAINFNTTLPPNIVPSWMPLSIFFDIGTYSGAWSSDALTSHFLYTGGLQLSLFQDIIRFYAPIVYSSDFRDQLKTLPDQNTFWKKLSFSIELQNFHLKKLF